MTQTSPAIGKANTAFAPGFDFVNSPRKKCCPDIGAYQFVPDVPAGISLENLSEEKEFKIFPNPAKGHLQINNEVPGILEVMDVSGRKIGIYKIERPGFEMDIEGWKTGTYLIKFSSEKRVEYWKLLKD